MSLSPIYDVITERMRQKELWGVQDHHDLTWLAILTEEVGEAATEINDRHPSWLRDELVQVAAVAVAWLECIDRRTNGKDE